MHCSDMQILISVTTRNSITMALIKSINQNYKDLDNDQFYTPQDLQDLQDTLASPVSEWTDIGLSVRVKDIAVQYRSPSSVATREIVEYLKDEWRQLDPEEDRFSILLLRNTHLNWSSLQREAIEQVLFDKKNGEDKVTTWLYLFHTKHGLVNPIRNESYSIFQRIGRHPLARARKNYHEIEAHVILLNFLMDNTIETASPDQFLKQGRIKDSHFEEWQTRLEKANLWDEEEEILEVGGGRLLRNHFSVNSNFNRSGKFILTNKKLVFARRSFSFFGLGLAALVPILAFVRPANKIILLGRTFYQYLRIPFTVAKPLIRGMWPVVAGLAVSINFVNFDQLLDTVENFFDQLPGLNFVGPSINFVVENPAVLPAFGGIFAGLRVGFLRLFFRRQKLVYLPLNQLNFGLVDGREFVARWKVKGYQIVRAKEGIQYRIRLRSYDGDIDSSTLAMKMYLKSMEASYQIKQSKPDNG